MDFDAKAFTAQIERISDLVYRNRTISGNTKRGRSLCDIRVSLQGSISDLVEFHGIVGRFDTSAHEKLAQLQGRRDIIEIAREIAQVFARLSPILSKPDLVLQIRIAERKQARARAILTINGHTIGASPFGEPVGMEALNQGLEELFKVIGGVGPGSLTFATPEGWTMQAPSRHIAREVREALVEA